MIRTPPEEGTSLKQATLEKGELSSSTEASKKELEVLVHGTDHEHMSRLL